MFALLLAQHKILIVMPTQTSSVNRPLPVTNIAVVSGVQIIEHVLLYLSLSESPFI